MSEHQIKPVNETSNDNNSNQNSSEDLTEKDRPELEEWETQLNQHKSLADDAFRLQNFPSAIVHYTTALALDPEHHILLSNRSAAYLSNGEKSRALADARKCTKVKPDWAKGHSRLAAAMMSLGRFSEAQKTYCYILSKLDSNNFAATDGLDKCRKREKKQKEIEREMIKLACEEPTQFEEKEDDTNDSSIEESQSVDAQTLDSKILPDPKNEDLLDDFFDEVEKEQVKKKAQISLNTAETESKAKENPQKNDGSQERQKTCENRIKIQLSDLGTTTKQISRILCLNHKWYNLNPFRVLDISHRAPFELISRRYKALSLLVHPDKIISSESEKNQAKEAFEYVTKSMNALKDEDKARHVRDLVEQGFKQGKKDYGVFVASLPEDAAQCDDTQHSLIKFQEKATMKIFAEIERKRQDVERRKRTQEQRERSQEDAEVEKLRNERDFEKKWRKENRVKKRVGNWRNFQDGDSGKVKNRKT